MGESRGSIAFFGTYRPPVPLDIYSRPAQAAAGDDEQLLTDGDLYEAYNQNGREIPPAALEELLTFLTTRPPLTFVTDSKRESGLQELFTFLSTRNKNDPAKKMKGLLFVSERDNGLETLHVALSWDGKRVPTVLRLADIYGADNFGSVRVEDCGGFAGGFSMGGRAVGHSVVYVSTKEPVRARRTPWTVVYKTNLADGKTERLTPPDQYDLSPAVSPSGKMVAVANFQFHRWNGEIELLKTDIVIMNVDRQAQGGLRRKVLIKDGGWPTWGSDKVLFFHRGNTPDPKNNRLAVNWRVFRYDMDTGKEELVRDPENENIDVMTPAAINETTVAVATIRKKSNQNVSVAAREPDQYRHIEIFQVTAPDQPKVQPVRITLNFSGTADHYAPFVLHGGAGGTRIGYHRCRIDKLKPLNSSVETATTPLVAPNKLYQLQMPESHKDVGLFRVSGVFPSFSEDGSKLAFVDNEFKAVWLADEEGLRVIHKWEDANMVFSTSWGKLCKQDGEVVERLFVCDGRGFIRTEDVDIKYIEKDPRPVEPGHDEHWTLYRLTLSKYNNAFPSTSPDGKWLVFRSTRDREPNGDRLHTNLYIMDAMRGEHNEKARQLTNGPWVDTHCSWAPSGNWIVFSSSRDKAPGLPDRDLLDAGFFSVYLVDATDLVSDPNNREIPAPVRVIHSSDTFRGHVNHPMFSPDMRSLVFTADLAAVSVEPISMPIFIHSVRPYGDIFCIDLRDSKDMAKNKDIREYHRLTHSRYEYSTPAWTSFRPDDPHTQWNIARTMFDKLKGYEPTCPYLHAKNHEGWHMAGHLTMVTTTETTCPITKAVTKQTATRFC